MYVSTNWTLNVNSARHKEDGSTMFTVTPLSKTTMDKAAKTMSVQFGKGQLGAHLKVSLKKHRYMTYYLELDANDTREHHEALECVQGASRWYSPAVGSTLPKQTKERKARGRLLVEIMSGMLLINLNVCKKDIGWIFDTQNVLDGPISKRALQLQLPTGYHPTPVVRTFPCGSHGFLIGNHPLPRQMTHMETVEQVPYGTQRYEDVIELAQLYYRLSWSPEIMFRSQPDQQQLEVIYPEDDGSIEDIMCNIRIRDTYLEVYVYRDLLQYGLLLGRAGYVLTQWDPLDWRSSHWNLPSRRILLISSRHCLYDGSRTAKERVSLNWNLLVDAMVSCMYKKTGGQGDLDGMTRLPRAVNLGKFHQAISKSEDNRKQVETYLTSLRSKHPTAAKGYKLLIALWTESKSSKRRRWDSCTEVLPNKKKRSDRSFPKSVQVDDDLLLVDVEEKSELVRSMCKELDRLFGDCPEDDDESEIILEELY